MAAINPGDVISTSTTIDHVLSVEVDGKKREMEFLTNNL
jgi:hypothetical protein